MRPLKILTVVAIPLIGLALTMQPPASQQRATEAESDRRRLVELAEQRIVIGKELVTLCRTLNPSEAQMQRMNELEPIYAANSAETREIMQRHPTWNAKGKSNREGYPDYRPGE